MTITDKPPYDPRHDDPPPDWDLADGPPPTPDAPAPEAEPEPPESQPPARTKTPPRPSSTAPPHDLAAERGALSIILTSLEGCDLVIETGLTAGDFYAPLHADIYTAAQACLAAGEIPDLVTVNARLPPGAYQPAQLVEATAKVLIRGKGPAYARRIMACARARAIQGAALEVAAAAQAGDIPLATSKINDLTDAVPTGLSDAIKHQTLGPFIASDEPEYDWIIEGLLERTDRVLLTGPEGGGKSTLLRQIAVQAAAGIHPFTHIDIPPLRVLLLDLENSERHIRRGLRSLRTTAERRADDNLTIAVHPQGLDLTDPGDVSILTHLIATTGPDLVIGGPIYKLVGGDPTEEQPAKAAAMTLDRLRTTYGFALALETHQPHGSGVDRPERPYGASLWKRWPEFGLHISEAGLLRHWRGARDERAWPAALERGGVWPWSMSVDSKTLTYSRITELIREHGRKLSERELASLTGAPKTNVHNAIRANQARFDQLCAELEEVS